MPNIRKEFKYRIPNEYFSDDFSEGKTGTLVYEGPEYVTFEIDKNTGRETGWVLLSAEESERPTPQDSVRITVDCDDNPLLCELANDQGKDSDAEFMAKRAWKIKCKAPEGYVDVEVPVELHPRDIYDETKIKYDFDSKEFIIPIKTHKTVTKIIPEKITWDHFRIQRNRELQQTDGVLDEYMPEEQKQKWLNYKQLLRDAPEKLSEFGPFYAGMMLPTPPSDATSQGDDDLMDDIVWNEE